MKNIMTKGGCLKNKRYIRILMTGQLPDFKMGPSTTQYIQTNSLSLDSFKI